MQHVENRDVVINGKSITAFVFLLVAGYLVAAVAITFMARLAGADDEVISGARGVVIVISMHALALVAGYSFARSQMKRRGW
jgi:hypothetical protein